ncbi:hypothetical protein ACFXBB_35495 [Streptomyces scopuliridis]|uniref:hypothetical protein n=1 Tax=Streptomyces scopuliridis TaxID=452529 RepID=UPI0036A2E1D5
MGAPESNAGDEFRFWWAASRALELLDPGSDLRRVTVEGLVRVDDPDETYETVDVAEYYGGSDAAEARALVMSQLKYSTRHPDRPWTASRLCEPRGRRAGDGPASAARSVVADLAVAYRSLRADHGADAVEKSRIVLVSNCPAIRTCWKPSGPLRNGSPPRTEKSGGRHFSPACRRSRRRGSADCRTRSGTA